MKETESNFQKCFINKSEIYKRYSDYCNSNTIKQICRSTFFNNVLGKNNIHFIKDNELCPK